MSLLRMYKRRKDVNNYINNIDLRDANYGAAVREFLSLRPRGCKKIPSLVITDGIFKNWLIPRKDDKFYSLECLIWGNSDHFVPFALYSSIIMGKSNYKLYTTKIN